MPGQGQVSVRVYFLKMWRLQKKIISNGIETSETTTKIVEKRGLMGWSWGEIKRWRMNKLSNEKLWDQVLYIFKVIMEIMEAEIVGRPEDQGTTENGTTEKFKQKQQE